MPDDQPERQEAAAGVATGPGIGDKPAVPASAERPAPPVAAPATRPWQRNPVFAELVQGEEDLAGLVGYALYKLNKRDWLASFFKTHGRDPTEDEVESYILGERTQRRLTTYRRLAEDMIGRKAAIAERNDAAASAAAATAPQRISAMKANSLRSSLAPEAPPAAPRRSTAATLIFWIAVLLVLAGAGYYYVNYSSLFLGR
ncbi:hypothetical protein SAMN05519103_07151 [Rhizobiales bacterium GAS113]|jgi:hypothetical protein|nr:hypothetical protein SAMN05519103_07151 [Rhizobiales bacterium GAS113]